MHDAPIAASLEELTGWGLTAPSAAEVLHPTDTKELADGLTGLPPRGAIARGLGRSYGDQAQNAGGRVLDTTGVARIRSIDIDTGVVEADAGVSIDTLIRVLLPLGWFVPVTPGTRFVTVGGAIAADIHGKNHHVRGSWCDNVLSLRVALPDGSIADVGPQAHPELFWATAGGLGLTGTVLTCTFRCTPVETSRLLVDTDRCRDLDTVMRLMTEGEEHHPYSVAWIDLMATGSAMGRSVLTQGRFATRDELGPKQRREPHRYDARVLLSAPPLIPNGLLNTLTVRMFNEVWYRRFPSHREGELQTIPTFFHPLDMIGHWNRLYGPQGFVQWQYVVPFGAEETVRHTVERLSSAGCPTFLAVLKRFGAGNVGPLSFPQPGWTLALDIPAGVDGLPALLDELDQRITEAGGRVYLAKDSRVRAELLPAMYPRLDEWRAVRDAVDPARTLRSDLSRRLGL
jgi:decaprenylphospho-beta-D-ribofuranose 2-oxidase